jgi:hypothetical protein
MNNPFPLLVQLSVQMVLRLFGQCYAMRGFSPYYFLYCNIPSLPSLVPLIAFEIIPIHSFIDSVKCIHICMHAPKRSAFGLCFRGFGMCFTLLCAVSQRVNVFAMPIEEQQSFFINIYNALVIHATVVFGHPESAYRRMLFFSYVSMEFVSHYRYAALALPAHRRTIWFAISL